MPTRPPGRPKKFGRATEPITIRLPQDVIDELATVDQDLAWAIIKLLERSRRSPARRFDLAGLFQIPGGRALILVRPEFFDDLLGVSLIPLSDGRAFLALDASKGVADLERAVVERLDHRLAPSKRAALERLRELLLKWKLDGVDFEARTIVIAKRPSKRPKPLATLRSD